MVSELVSRLNALGSSPGQLFALSVEALVLHKFGESYFLASYNNETKRMQWLFLLITSK